LIILVASRRSGDVGGGELDDATVRKETAKKVKVSIKGARRESSVVEPENIDVVCSHKQGSVAEAVRNILVHECAVIIQRAFRGP